MFPGEKSFFCEPGLAENRKFFKDNRTYKITTDVRFLL
jgi:hypothetical protein